MKKVLTFVIALAFTLGVSAQNYGVIEPELQKVLNQKSNDKISVNIVLDTQADNELLLVKYDGINDKSLQRENVIKELKAFATDNQNKLMALLQDEAGNDKVVDIKAHWIVNTINCSATRDVIYKLSEQPGISVIGLNDKVKLLSNEKPTRVSQSKSIIDNVTTVGADNVWAAGYTGKDVTVALLDSGVNSEHVDLADHLWDGGDEYPDHGWNFIDNNSNTNDYDGHGTHCAGTICGDGTSGIQTGMAPDATLMCLKVLDDEGYGTLEALVSGVEFAVEHGADIMSISLGWVNPNTYVSIIMREMFENVLATGVVAAVAAGNERAGIDTIPIPRNINAPGNCPPPWLHPDQQYNPGGLSAVVSVGAVDYSDDVAYFSSRGPVTWQGTEWDDYKYDFRYNDNINEEEGWIYYDNGFGTDGVGGPDYFQWGIMIPASKLQQYEGSYMTKVAIYDLVADNPQLLIYYGGDYAPETLVYVQDCELSGSNSMLEIELDEALPIYNENIWVVMYTQNGASYPAACCDNTGDPNGRWISLDGTTWDDLVNYGLNNTWMLRAYVTDYSNMAVAELNTITDYEFTTSSKGTLSVSGLRKNRMSATSDEDHFGLIRPDVCAPGVDIVSAAFDDNDGFYFMSGTSMATPCVAGVMALMLDKDPSLTPADICRILETTATKLESTKSNFTGSGRINADMAINEIENTGGNDPTTQNYRNVLIEEFTGRSCVYCPMGHAAINDVIAENPSKVFVVNYHSQSSLSPTSYPNLNVTESTTFFNAFNIQGIPNVAINRTSTMHPLNCASSVEAQLEELTEVKIEGNVVINPVARQAEITVELDYLSNSNYSTNYLTIIMLQDSIFGSQSGADQSNPEQIVDGQYCHMHVLRDVITNTWGDAIAPTTAGSHLTKTYIYEIPEVIGTPNGVEVDLDNIYFLAFVTEKQDGTPTLPVLNVNKLEKTYNGNNNPLTTVHSKDLTSGWNWYSTYIVNEGAEGLANLEAAVGTNGIQIKNQTTFVNQASGNWYGTLTSTAVEDMFMIQMSAAHTLELEGYVVNPADYPITLGTNWKWIGYPLAAEISVEEAFASANPSNGDYVKSQKGFAQYYEGLGWSGTLQSMTPGMGYMYQNTSGYAKTLVYPMANAKSLTQVQTLTQTQTLTYWDVDVTKYPMNMTVIAVVENAARDYEVAAFSNGECRGSARPIYIEALGQSMIFMTIYGDDKDAVSFRYYDVTTGEEVALNDEMTFEANATHGDVMQPYVMTLSTMGIDETSAGFNIYPNPVQDKLYIETQTLTQTLTIEIYDVYGRVQNLRNSETQKLRNSIDVSNLNSGIYFIQIKTEEGNITKRFVKE